MSKLKGFKIVRSPEIDDEEYPEVHFHNGVDQPEIGIGDLPIGTDHATLTNVTVDQHHARDHASRHLSGGGDALTLTNLEVPTSAWGANIIPATDSTYDLGSSSKFWKDIYADNLVGPTVFNELGADVDFRIEGDANANLVYTDASTDRVGIKTATPGSSLDVAGSFQADSITNDTGLAAGVYTPTRSAEVNLDANAIPTEAQYIRVGNTVTVSGRFTADPTTTTLATSFEMTLPIASNLGAVEDLAGVAFCGNIVAQGAEVIGVVANDTAKIQWKAGDVTSQVWSYIFAYQVI